VKDEHRLVMPGKALLSSIRTTDGKSGGSCFPTRPQPSISDDSETWSRDTGFDGVGSSSRLLLFC
jgi:hypothetical protein